jgi:hypothetical protein
MYFFQQNIILIFTYVLLNVLEYKSDGRARRELQIQMQIMVPSITHLDNFGLNG